MATTVITPANTGDDDDRLPELAQAIRDELARWHEQAMALWDVTARIGSALRQAYEQIGDEAWPGWLDGLRLTPYQAFLFMRAECYPDLMRRDKPASLEAVSRLLPQGQGEAYDKEQAAMARRLHAAGLSKREVRVRFGVSDTTLTRWLEPERYQERKRKQWELDRRRQLRQDQERERKRAAAMKARGGPGSRAWEDLTKAITATDEAYRAAADPFEKRALSAVLRSLYEAKDKLWETLGAQ